ncbi:MAG: efflux RND transporter permease subunit [Candidatus Krumholzibacteria bacterium]
MTQFFVRHPVTTWMIFAVFVLLGVYALPKLQVEAIPEINLPTLTVQTYWNGASPRAIQRSITIPIEEAARKIHGVEEIVSTSYAGRSRVQIKFRRDINIDFARVDLNEQLGSVRRNLPLNAAQPQILPYVPEEFATENFFTFSLESDLSPNELRDLAETWVVPQILALEGVADARVLGGADPLLKIYLDRQKLDLYGITPDEVFAAVNRLDELSGAGVVQQSGMEKIVALRDPVDLRRVRRAVVARRGDRVFTLNMLGTVERDFEDPVYFVRTNARNVVQISVDKRSGANTITASRVLRKALPHLQDEVPFAASFDIDEDQGEELEAKLRELVLRSFVILGLLFLLLSITLRQLRLTAIITGSIIFSVLISLSLFYFLGISVNFITISGLTVCFGLILDNSILVLDAIHRRLGAMEHAEAAGLSRAARLKVALETILGGSREVLFPILATTLTTIVAFVSFIFLSGRLALFYVPLGVSVATALGASLFVAFGWVPMVLHRGWAVPLVRRAPDGPNDVTDPKELARFTEDLPDLSARPPRLERLCLWNQRLWWLVLPLLATLFVWSGHVYKTRVVKGGFWRLPDPEQLLVYIRMPPGTDITLTSETMALFESAILPVPEGARMRSQTFGNQAVMRVEFEGDVLQSEVPLYFRTVFVDQADKLAGMAIYISGFSETPYINGGFSGSSLNSLVKMTGYNSRRLQEIAEEALAQIERNRRVRNPRITTGSRFGRASQEEVVINIDRDRLATHGLSVADVVSRIRRLLGVDVPWNMLIEGDNQRVQLSFTDSEEMEYHDAVQTLVTTPSGASVRLADLISIETVPLSGEITREDQRYSTYLNWEYIGTDQMRQAYIKSVIGSMTLPYGYEAEESTREFFTEEEEEELMMALVLAIVFIFMVLAALFESITLPVMVLMSLPMALVGVFHGFWWTNSSFDSSARIGLILLFGIVVNNAILLLSRFRTEATLTLQVRLGGDPTAEASLFPSVGKQLGGSDLWKLPKKDRVFLLRRAIARGLHVRLRSILLTSGTTIVGLAPLLIHFRDTEDKDIWENLALASIAGLASSTLLILVAIPPLYYVSVRFNWLWRRMYQAVRRFFTRRRAGAERSSSVPQV